MRLERLLKHCLVLSIACGAWPLSAEEIDWANVDYVTLDTSDASTSVSSLLLGDRWSDGRIPHPDAHYMVPAGKTLYAIGGELKNIWKSAPTNSTFQGASLSIAGTIGLNTETIRINNFRMLDGGAWAQNPYAGFAGPATVCSVSTPFDFQLTRNKPSDSRVISFSVVFQGAADAQMKFRRYSNNLQSGFNLVNSDFSRYFGTIICGSGNNGTAGCTNFFGNATIPGTCIVEPLATMQLGNKSYAATVGTLQLDAGSILRLKSDMSASACITVTNRLVVAEGASLCMDGNWDAYLTTKTQPKLAILKLTGPAAATENLPALENFVLTGPNPIAPLPPAVLSIEDDATTGGKTIYYMDCANHLLKDNNGNNDPQVLATNVETARVYWSAGHVPQAGEDVFVPNSVTLATWNDENAFVGRKLVLGGTLYMRNAAFAVPEMHLLAGAVAEAPLNGTLAQSYSGLSYAHVLSGTLHIHGTDASPNLFNAACGQTFVVASSLQGSGTVHARTRGATSYPYCAIAVLATNSAFAGKFTVTSKNSKLNPSAGNILRFYMDHAQNLGGAMDGFHYDGITFENDSIVIGRQPLTFDVPTRGVFISNRIRFVMRDDARLKFAVPVTWHGEMVFGNNYPNAPSAAVGSGTGDLELAGRAQFIDGGGAVADAPDASCPSNQLMMIVGRVKPMSTNALDGVAVTFGAQSGGILLDIDPQGDGVAQYGLYDVKWNAPLATQRADGKIPVTFEGMSSADYEGSPIVRGICTVSAAAAESIPSSLFAVAKPYGNVAVSVTRTPNADQTVTISAVIKTVGFMVIFK